MFEVYLNDRRDLLVVKKGSPIPLIAASGKWRMKKKVLRVSDEIRSAVQRHGYYVRKLSDAKNGSLRPVGLAHGFGHVQSLQHHHKPSRDHRAVPGHQPLRRQLAAETPASPLLNMSKR